MAQLGPLFTAPLFQPQNIAGLSIPGAILTFFLGDSATPAAVYLDPEFTEDVTSVTADDTGTFPKIFVDPAITYKVVLTGPDDMINPPTEYFSVYPYKGVWPSGSSSFEDIGFSWLNADPLTTDIIGMYTAIRPQTIPGNFDGTPSGGAKAYGNVLTDPGAEAVVWCYHLNVTAVGYMRIQADGTIDFFTDGGSEVALDTGEFIVWRLTADSDFANLSWTIFVENDD